jgi:hypothetical protein
MEEPKIMIIGCGDAGRAAAELAIIRAGAELGPMLEMHIMEEPASAAVLATTVEDFTQRDYKVLVIDDGMQLMAALPEKIFTLTAPPRLDPDYHISIKDLQKPAVYPKTSYKRRLKKNKKYKK